MSTFVVVHGGGDVGWSWHLVAAELRARGHEVLTPDLPADDDALTLDDYATAVVEIVGARGDVVVVGHSFGAFTAPLVAERLSAGLLVLMAGMIPAPGEPPERWWEESGYLAAAKVQSALDGGLTGNEDPYVSFYADVPRELADEALRQERAHPSSTAMERPWPLAEWPQVPTRFVVFADDRFFPAAFLRELAQRRLGVVADEIPGGHCAMLSRPVEIAELLSGYVR
ncbi:alpha/beta fold hydrolase [Microbacterium sp. MYb66]|uniref:alpha/beta fold hydrolase n=1 Tax=Microbacterium sp. MYb66 TaxID=1848692 RepID=UPI000CFF11B2|nr:alpha/beta hydrolase [Microbacterium sp. MYb66]PRA83155.1 alpha/beta hydrolase [Microbacterium sp. MYb66]